MAMYYSFKAVVEGQKVTFAENNPIEGKYEAVVILTAPLNTENSRVLASTQPVRTVSAPVSPSPVSPSAGEPRPERSATGFGFRQSTFGDRSSPPVTPSSPEPAKETLSPLYSDRDKRDDRRVAQTKEQYVDVNKDAFQRLLQGEQTVLSFEVSGHYLSSPFILVENGSQLYLNFYQFNEGKQLPQDKEKLLSQIFEIKGSLPNIVIGCKPAQMVPKSNGYIVAEKGELILKGFK